MKETRHAWVEPYYDNSGGDIVMSTYSVPLFRKKEGKKEFIGVATVDVSLAWLQKIVSSIRTGTTGSGFLVSKMGTFVTHPDSHLVMRKTITGLARKRGDKALSEIGLKVIRGETGLVPYNGFFYGEILLDRLRAAAIQRVVPRDRLPEGGAPFRYYEA